jgi:hypothetical protein
MFAGVGATLAVALVVVGSPCGNPFATANHFAFRAGTETCPYKTDHYVFYVSDCVAKLVEHHFTFYVYIYNRENR